VTNDATLYFLGCHAVAVVGSPAAVASSGKLSSGACPDWGGAGSISRLVFYLTFLVDRFGGGMA